MIKNSVFTVLYSRYLIRTYRSKRIESRKKLLALNKEFTVSCLLLMFSLYLGKIYYLMKQDPNINDYSYRNIQYNIL